MAEASRRPDALGFGFRPGISPYHFLVRRDPDGAAEIVERFVFDTAPEADQKVEAVKVRLSAYLWERIADSAAAEFNDRLRHDGLRAARWLQVETQLAPHFGKELALLGWAVEDADPTLVPTMIANWRGLAPEERWWFYTTINATNSYSDHGKDRGWRKAIKIAFADNPVHVPPTLIAAVSAAPGTRPRKGGKTKPDPDDQGALRLPLGDPS
jgi:hypothetical protein